MTNQIRVAKAGKNALTATDPNDFIFHSAYNTFKILKEGTLLAQLVDASSKEFSVAHDQSAIPTALAFAKYPDGYIALPREYPRSGEQERYFNLEMDATNLYFVFNRGGTANYSVDIKYYVFEAPAT